MIRRIRIRKVFQFNYSLAAKTFLFLLFFPFLHHSILLISLFLLILTFLWTSNCFRILNHLNLTIITIIIIINVLLYINLIIIIIILKFCINIIIIICLGLARLLLLLLLLLFLLLRLLLLLLFFSHQSRIINRLLHLIFRSLLGRLITTPLGRLLLLRLRISTYIIFLFFIFQYDIAIFLLIL